jgi:hypothetical protein
MRKHMIVMKELERIWDKTVTGYFGIGERRD